MKHDAHPENYFLLKFSTSPGLRQWKSDRRCLLFSLFVGIKTQRNINHEHRVNVNLLPWQLPIDARDVFPSIHALWRDDEPTPHQVI